MLRIMLSFMLLFGGRLQVQRLLQRLDRVSPLVETRREAFELVRDAFFMLEEGNLFQTSDEGLRLRARMSAALDAWGDDSAEIPVTDLADA
jgi:hypothetical protein